MVLRSGWCRVLARAYGPGLRFKGLDSCPSVQMTRVATPSPDSVSEALRAVAVRSSIFCLSELRAPWALHVFGEDVAKFHLVLEGDALLSCPPSPPFALGTGDLVVLPHGAAHTLADSDATAAVPLEDLLAADPLDGGWLHYGGSRRPTPPV